MKLLFIFAFVFSLSISNLSGQESKQTKAIISSIQSSNKIAPLLKFAEVDYFQKQQNAASSNNKNGYLKRLPIQVEQNANGVMIPLLLKTNDIFSTSSLINSVGGSVAAEIGDILTAKIPLGKIHQVAQNKNVIFIDASYPRTTQLDKVKSLIQADLVHEGYVYPGEFRGEDVIVGVIDTGIDVTHPDFKDENGSRVLYIWDQTIESEAAPEDFGYGTEYTKFDIDSGNIQHYDLAGHGTHVSGIAAGNGNLFTPFTGIAPKSDIIMVRYGIRESLVKAVVDTSFDFDVINGCKYIFDKADELGKPAVINMSIGAHFGPHDGTSLLEQAMDELTGEGKIAVVSAANSGSFLQHVSYHASGEDFETSKRTYVKPYSPVLNDFWYDTGNISVGYVIENRSTGEVIYNGHAAPGEGLRDTVFVDTTFLALVQIDATLTNDPFNNGSRVITLLSTNQDIEKLIEYNWAIYTFGTGRIHGWIQNEDGFLNWPADESNVEFADSLYSIVPPGTALESISVGSFDSKASWYSDSTGYVQQFDVHPGEISFFSSIGPTRDGRIKPEIAAPGHFVASAFSSATQKGNFSFLVNDGGYYMKRGTSMAAPVVTGSVALLLEQNPNYDYDDIIEIFRATAHRDEFTGPVPNNFFGWGKLNIFDAMNHNVTGVEDGETTVVEYSLNQNYPNPFNPSTVINYSVPSKSKVTLKVYDILGKEVANLVDKEKSAGNHKVEFNASNLSSGVYFYRLTSDNFTETRKMMLLK